MIAGRDECTRVVARFTDGRMLKGTTHDFAPLKTQFHVYESGNVAAQTTRVSLADLKAVFFVRTFEGDPGHVADNELATARGQGRRVRVTFLDGEVVAGFTVGFSEDEMKIAALQLTHGRAICHDAGRRTGGRASPRARSRRRP